VALVAAYALALQTLFLAAALGAQAAQASNGEFLVICSPSGNAPDAPAHDKAGHRADCCVLGGSMLGQLLAPPSAATLSPPQAKAISHLPIAEMVAHLARPHSPLTARGPPVA
jgi:hypothetical protein